jgi:hypothetical protein
MAGGGVVPNAAARICNAAARISNAALAELRYVEDV